MSSLPATSRAGPAADGGPALGPEHDTRRALPGWSDQAKEGARVGSEGATTRFKAVRCLHVHTEQIGRIQSHDAARRLFGWPSGLRHSEAVPNHFGTLTVPRIDNRPHDQFRCGDEAHIDRSARRPFSKSTGYRSLWCIAAPNDDHIGRAHFSATIPRSAPINAERSGRHVVAKMVRTAGRNGSGIEVCWSRCLVDHGRARETRRKQAHRKCEKFDHRDSGVAQQARWVLRTVTARPSATKSRSTTAELRVTT